ncbi:MAG TPA: hypothetical protein VFY20_03395 [Gemmatimonadales bacterium]|nr:hypothetical protein [Gemmatimonadales bacterium]
MRRIAVLFLSLGVLGVAACGDDSSDTPGPDDPGTTRPPEELSILRLAADAPPLFENSVTFWAVRGEDREGRLYFSDGQGQRGEEYLRLRIGSSSLLARPDGTPIAAGDSVQITVTVVDPTQILFQFAPEGLTFSSSSPAELDIEYDEAGDDLNDDGSVDDEDDDVESRLGVWRQATVGQPFVRLGSAVIEDLREIEAELTSFSRYAIAY